jgi:hypothetical protein
MRGTALQQNATTSQRSVDDRKHDHGGRRTPARMDRMKPALPYLHERRKPLARKMRRHWQVLLGVCLLSLVSACGAKSGQDDTAMGSIDGYNSTDQAITPFYVNNHGGVSINAYSGGGSVCCILYPRKWHPGLTAKVKWATSSGKSDGDPTWHEAEVPIEPYDVPGSMNVHFLPNDEVRIVIFNGSPRAEGYKGPPYPEAPPGWSTRSDVEDAGVPPVPAAPQGETK